MGLDKTLYEDLYNKGFNFSFGKNWRNFLKLLNKKKINEAKESLIDFLGGEDKIKGKTFIDVGCGSGLFSLSAYLLGAKEIVSLDIDDNSVACAKILREKEGNPKNRKIITGSILNEKFIKTLGTYDIVYSRGVLHHTGNMDKAFDNVVNLIGDKGMFYIAIYNKYITSKTWWYVKKIYNHTSKYLKRIWIGLYYIYATIILAVQKKWILSEIKHFSSSRGSGRGMSYHTDVLDWLGGYPYEYATTKEIIEYFKKHNLKTVKFINGSGPACNEVLFQKL